MPDWVASGDTLYLFLHYKNGCTNATHFYTLHVNRTALYTFNAGHYSKQYVINPQKHKRTQLTSFQESHNLKFPPRASKAKFGAIFNLSDMPAPTYIDIQGAPL